MKRQFLLICVGNIEAYPAEQQLVAARVPVPRGRAPAPGGARNQPDNPAMEFSTRGWIFENEENLDEFAEERLREHPHEKLIKYSPVILFETQPSPMIRKPIEAEESGG